MNSTPTPKATEPDDAPTARADERLAHAYEQITRADEKLAQLSEQVEKMERDAAPRRSSAELPSSAERQPSAEFGPPSPPRKPALRALVGLALAACIIVAALFLQSSYGARAKLVVARWAPQLASTPSLPPGNPPAPAQPAPSPVQLAAADAVVPQAAPPPQAAPRDAPPTAAPAASDQTQLLQTMARDLAELARTVEQLKASEQQTAGDNAKAIEQLKASQEELKRALAKVSEQNVPKASPAPTQPSATLRRLGRMVHAPRPRPRPPRTYSREWIYDDYDW
jgi:uncharacterized membrane protein YccC